MKDEALEEIHAIRQQIWEECGRDVDRYFDRLRKVSAQHPEQVAKFRALDRARLDREAPARVAEEP